MNFDGILRPSHSPLFKLAIRADRKVDDEKMLKVTRFPRRKGEAVANSTLYRESNHEMRTVVDHRPLAPMQNLV